MKTHIHTTRFLSVCSIQSQVKVIILVCIGNLFVTLSYGQATLPSVSSLPFSFSSYTGTVFPTFLTIGKSSGTGLSTADFTTDAANGSSGAQWRAEGNNGVSYQGGSGSTTPLGCFQVRVNAS